MGEDLDVGNISISMSLDIGTFSKMVTEVQTSYTASIRDMVVTTQKGQELMEESFNSLSKTVSTDLKQINTILKETNTVLVSTMGKMDAYIDATAISAARAFKAWNLQIIQTPGLLQNATKMMQKEGVQIQQITRQTNESSFAMRTYMEQMRMESQRSSKVISEATRNIGKEARYMASDVTRLTAEASKGMSSALKPLARPLGRAGEASAPTFTSTSVAMAGAKASIAITAPATMFAKQAIGAYSQFNSAMTESTAIMTGAHGAMRKVMEDTAKDLASKGTTSAIDLAKSYYYLAVAGYDAQKSVAALGTVQRFATAGAFDMKKATDLLTDAQSALGMSVANANENSKNMTRLSDVLVRANTLANASVEQFSEALKSDAAAAMRSFNIPLEEGVAILAAYADQGNKAVPAGSDFARMLRLMINAINENGAAWSKYKIKTKDARGNLAPIADIIGDITKVSKSMGTLQKGTFLKELGFEALAQNAILPLLGTQDAIRRYRTELEKASGFTESVASKQMQSFANKMKVVWGNVENLRIEIGERLAPVILRIGDYLMSGIKLWNSLGSGMKDLVVYAAAAAAAIGPLLVGMAGFMAVASYLSKVTIVWNILVGAITTGVSVIVGALGLLTSPIALLLTAVGALGVAMALTSDIGSQAFQGLKEVMGTVADTFVKMWGNIKLTAELIMDALGKGQYRQAATILWADLRLIYATGVKALADNFGTMYDAALDTWTDIKRAGAMMFKDISSGMYSMGISITQAIRKVLDFIMQGIYNNPLLSDSQAQAVLDKWNDMSTTLQNIGGKMIADRTTSDIFYNKYIKDLDKPRIPIAEQAGKDLKAAQIEYNKVTLGAMGATLLDSLSKKKDDAMSWIQSKIDYVADATKTGKTDAGVMAKAPGEDTGLVSGSSGSFQLASISATGAINDAQNTRKEQLSTLKDIYGALTGKGIATTASTTSTGGAITIG